MVKNYKPTWRPSPCPEEHYGDAEGEQKDGKWAYDITGEEIDHEGKLQYEVRWETWSRENATKTTWRDPDSINSAEWDKRRRKEFKLMAAQNQSVSVPTTTDYHNFQTYARNEGYTEKLAKATKQGSINQIQAMRTLMKRHEHLDHLESSGTGRVSVSDGSQASQSPLRASKRICSRNLSSTPSSSIQLSISSEKGSDMCSLSRNELQSKWSRAARKAGAAPITIVNLVDNDDIPPISSSFAYLESTYNYANDVDVPASEGFLMTCDCDVCADADICGCQGESLVVDLATRSAVYAYTPSGKFAFNVARGVEVIECNKFCNCEPTSCPNRVSQRPRDIPIEIFKTDVRGWGARAPVFVERGKVLGIYTGLVIHRESYNAKSDDQSMYCFDLDGDERAGAHNQVPHKLYSVDAMHQGNWTRFINHSCSPNIQVYLVVHNTPSGIGMPFIAFVATKNIPAMTEFTLDYDPIAGEEVAAARSKSKGKKPKASHIYAKQPRDQICSCGAADCRGYMP